MGLHMIWRPEQFLWRCWYRKAIGEPSLVMGRALGYGAPEDILKEEKGEVQEDGSEACVKDFENNAESTVGRHVLKGLH